MSHYESELPKERVTFEKRSFESFEVVMRQESFFLAVSLKEIFEVNQG